MQGQRRPRAKWLIWTVAFLSTLTLVFLAATSAEATPKTIESGTTWLDTSGNPVNAHGGGMIKVGRTYYWIGEHKDADGLFDANACYRSTNLKDWLFVNFVLEKQESGDLGPNRVVERPKIIYNDKTKMYVQTMHVDDPNYDDPGVGVATSRTVCGDYTYQGRMRLNGYRIGKWDQGLFKDDDGTGYLITHSGNIYRLADDYLSAVAQPLGSMCSNCESPALFKKDGTYYFLFSSKTGWKSNDNFYFTANSLTGPWSTKKYLAPAGAKTWDSQTTFVLPVQGTEGTAYMFMGDRWNGDNLGTSTYVWQPLVIDGTSLSLPTFKERWSIDTVRGKAT
jgi:hypothetical protein